MDAQEGRCDAPGPVASSPVRQRDDVASPPGSRDRGVKGILLPGKGGVTVLGAPTAGSSREHLVAGGVIEPYVAKSRVRQRHAFQEAAFGGLDLQIFLRQTCAGKADRADGTDQRVDGELVAGSCERDAVMSVVDEVQLADPDERDRVQVGRAGTSEAFTSVSESGVERSEDPVEVLAARQGPDDRLDGHGLGLSPDESLRMVGTASERGQRLVQPEQRLHVGSG